jgi:uncharacterized cupredoxin-like copper-binding protein
MRRIPFLAALLVIAVLALTACSSSQAAGSAQSSSTSSSSVPEVTVKGTEFAFNPARLTFKAGQPVRLVFNNAGTIDHALVIENMKADNVQLDLGKAGTIPEGQRTQALDDAQKGTVRLFAAAGKQATAEFTPQGSGTFQMICDLPGHKESGMVGQVTVQP